MEYSWFASCQKRSKAFFNNLVENGLQQAVGLSAAEKCCTTNRIGLVCSPRTLG